MTRLFEHSFTKHCQRVKVALFAVFLYWMHVFQGHHSIVLTAMRCFDEESCCCQWESFALWFMTADLSAPTKPGCFESHPVTLNLTHKMLTHEIKQKKQLFLHCLWTSVFNLFRHDFIVSQTVILLPMFSIKSMLLSWVCSSYSTTRWHCYVIPVKLFISPFNWNKRQENMTFFLVWSWTNNQEL